MIYILTLLKNGIIKKMGEKLHLTLMRGRIKNFGGNVIKGLIIFGRQQLQVELISEKVQINLVVALYAGDLPLFLQIASQQPILI